MSMVMMKIPEGHCCFMNESEFKLAHGQKGYSYARERDEKIAQKMGWVEKPKPVKKAKAAKKG